MKKKMIGFMAFLVMAVGIGGFSLASAMDSGFGQPIEIAHGSTTVRIPAFTTQTVNVDYGVPLTKCPCSATYSIANGQVIPEEIHAVMNGWGVGGITVKITNSSPFEKLVIVHAQGMGE